MKQPNLKLKIKCHAGHTQSDEYHVHLIGSLNIKAHQQLFSAALIACLAIALHQVVFFFLPSLLLNLIFKVAAVHAATAVW